MQDAGNQRSPRGAPEGNSMSERPFQRLTSGRLSQRLAQLSGGGAVKAPADFLTERRCRACGSSPPLRRGTVWALLDTSPSMAGSPLERAKPGLVMFYPLKLFRWVKVRGSFHLTAPFGRQPRLQRMQRTLAAGGSRPLHWQWGYLRHGDGYQSCGPLA